MPFTFAHPAIVLPLLKNKNRYFSATGLIVGSMAPDFESFINFGDRKVYSHYWSTAFLYDIPIALIVCFVFHLIVRDALIKNLPSAIKSRFVFGIAFDWLLHFKNKYYIIIPSIVIGILSHLFWDAFTHLNFMYPNSKSSTISIYHFRIYILLQYFCSIIGLIVITRSLILLPKKRIQKDSTGKFEYWIYIILLSVLIASYVFTNVSDQDSIDFIYVINVSISSALLSLVSISAVYRVLVFRRQQLL